MAETQQQNAKKIEFKVLSDRLRDWLSSIQLTFMIMELNKRLGFATEKEIVIPRAIWRLVSGQTEPQNFVSELSRELEISPSAAKTLAQEIEEKLLRPIEVLLRVELGVDVKLIYLTEAAPPAPSASAPSLPSTPPAPAAPSFTLPKIEPLAPPVPPIQQSAPIMPKVEPLQMPTPPSQTTSTPPRPTPPPVPQRPTPPPITPRPITPPPPIQPQPTQIAPPPSPEASASQRIKIKVEPSRVPDFLKENGNNK